MPRPRLMSYASSTYTMRKSSVGESDSIASSSTTMGVGTLASIRSTFFELVYLTSSPSKVFWILQLCFMVVDAVQMFSYTTDTSLRSWGNFSIFQKILALSRVTTMANYTNSNILLALGLLVVIFFLFFALMCIMAAKAIQRAQVPSMTLVRFIRLTLIFLTTLGFIPVFSVLVSLAAEYVPTSTNVVDIAVFASSVAMAAFITAVVACITMTSFPFGFTSSNPLSRLSSRIDMAYLVGKAVTVVLYQIPFLQSNSIVLWVWMAFFTTLNLLLYGIFIPYYSFKMNIIRTTSMAVLLVALAFMGHWAIGLCSLTLLLLAPGLVACSMLYTTALTSKFRKHVADMAPTDPLLLAPRFLRAGQVETALRHSRVTIAQAQRTMRNITRSIPVTIQEYSGGQSEGGMLNIDYLTEKQIETMKEMEAKIEREIDFGMRLFQFARAKWPTNQGVAKSYVCFSAAFRGETLQSAILSTSRALAALPWVLDVKYFQFICTKYRSALYEDSSVISKLEAQRNMAILLRSQRQLADALGVFWTQVLSSRGQQLTLSQFKALSTATERISTLQNSTEKLYQRMLANPTPRVLRSYSQYVQLFNSTDAVKNYCDELLGLADELEVAPASDNDTKTRLRFGPINLQGSTASYAFLHVRAVLSAVLIALLFTVSVGACLFILKLYEHIMYQTIGVISVATGIQHIAMGLVSSRSANPVILVSGTVYCGPIWSALIQELPIDVIKDTMALYYDASDMYINGDITISGDRYGPVKDINYGIFDTAMNTVLVAATHGLYNLPNLLKEQTIAVTKYQGGAPHHIETASLMEYVSELIQVSEAIAECFVERLEAGHSDMTTHCAPVTDTLLEYEGTLASRTVLDALDNVSNRVFVVSQLFVVIESALCLCIFFLFILCCFIVSIFLYLAPMAKDTSFTVHILQMFAGIPEQTLVSILDRFQAYRNSRLKSHEEAQVQSLGELIPSRTMTPYVSSLLKLDQTRSAPEHSKAWPRTEIINSSNASKSGLGTPAPMHSHSQLGDGDTSRSRLDLPHIAETASTLSDTSQPSPANSDTGVTDGEKTGAESADFVESAVALNQPSSVGRKTRSVVLQTASTRMIVDPLVITDGDDFEEGDLEDAGQFNALTARVASQKKLEVLEKQDSGSGVPADSQTKLVRSSSRHSVVMSNSTIRLSVAMRQLPALCSWMGLFAAIYILMCLFAIYQTADVSQTSVTMFYQYQSSVRLRGMILTAASCTVGFGTTSPTNLTIAQALMTRQFADAAPFVSHLSGDAARDQAIVVDAWDWMPSWGRSWNNMFLDIFIQDTWVKGSYSDEIVDLLYDAECVRILDKYCDASYSRPYSATKHGIITVSQAYLSSARDYAADMQSFNFATDDFLFMVDSVEKDVAPAIVRLSFILRDRFTELLSSTQSDMILFWVVFLLLLIIFYSVYLFRTIIRISKTRRHFGVLFKMLPRDELPSKLTDAFVEIFPDDSL
ncbi:tmcB-like protein [Carpediemonas membranifera]|uniref:TmcB-like protein n=1 Tax=Carpediemonas membranifera TaxID=201153 RepID=A0A8J6E1K1_9EUKA|nr:tmcB-like protein [Carpediemonas membranifera]|eukprot:KAG9396459.1 tmcB-like protein [Carpediemonas membranifera]